MSNSQNRRSRLLIDLPVQLGVALRLVMLWAATAIVASLVAVVMRFYADPHTTFLSHVTSPHHWAPSLIAFAVTLPIAVLDLIKFSHRFAGPVYRLRKELRALADGQNTGPLKFRKNDYWIEMADDFNAVALRLREASVNAAESDEQALVAAGEES